MSKPNRDFHHYMKVGLVHPMAFPQVLKREGPVVETLRRILQDGFFSAVDLIGSADAAVQAEVNKLIRNTAVEATFAAQSVLLVQGKDLNHADHAERQSAIDLIKGLVDEALAMGAARLSVLSGKDPGEAGRDEAYARLVDSMQQICGYAADQGPIPIALKVFDRDVEKKCLIGKADISRRLADDLRQDFPDFGLIHDLSHIPLLDETPAEILPGLADVLVQMHMGNCVKQEGHGLYGDQHPLFGVDGGVSGIDELADYLQVLFDVGFLGEGKRPFVGFEVKPHAEVDSEIVIANAKNALKAAWAKISA